MNETNEAAVAESYLEECQKNEETSVSIDQNDDPNAASDEPSDIPAHDDNDEKESSAEIDYAALAISDVKELRGEFPELSSLASLTELDDPIRYGALRDLGLTPKEAYLATRKRREVDNRAHLRPTRSVARGASPLMTEAEMSAARELFSGISDSEIRQLYKRVTK
jgi:hypothetical protein